METTANFKAGLQAAYSELSREGKLSETDHRVVGDLLANPVWVVDGKRIFALQRAHLRVRHYYARKMGVLLSFEIDWTAIVAWIKENWVQIVKILASLLLFLV